jgi:mannose-6-phosphate isomerase-like protein (cupin superfamily)
MPVINAADAVVHEMHGTTFVSYAAPSRGSEELCTWRVEIPAGSAGVPHTVTHEEVLCVVSGSARVTLGDETRDVVAGDVIVVTVGPTFCLETTAESGVAAWVTTSVGLQAQMPDGSSITPPWTL